MTVDAIAVARGAVAAAARSTVVLIPVVVGVVVVGPVALVVGGVSVGRSVVTVAVQVIVEVGETAEVPTTHG